MSDEARVPSFYQDGEAAADLYRFAVKGKDAQMYYVMYGDQADEIAKEYMFSVSVVKSAGNVRWLNVSDKLFRQMAWDLLRNKGKKVELYESTGPQRWECTLQASPGRLEAFEARFGNIAQSADAGCVACIQVKPDAAGGARVGCAYVNQTLRIIGVTEFDDEAATFSNLESFLLQVGAREAVLQKNGKRGSAEKAEDAKEAKQTQDVQMKLEDVIRHTNVHLESDAFKTSTVEQLPERLKFLLRDEHTVHESLQMPLASKALSNAISYLNLTAEECNEEQFTLRKEDLSKYLKLDVAAVRALNLFDDEMSSTGKGSLLGHMDRCSTPMGRRLMRMWVTQPLLDLDEITRRQDYVEVFVEDAMLRDALKETVLNQVPDLDKILKKVQRGRATLADCLKIGQFTAHVPKVKIHMLNYSGPHKGRIDAYVEQLSAIEETFEGLTALINEAIEVDENDREARIRASFDESLDELDVQRGDVRKQMNGEFRRVLKDTQHTDKEVKLEHSTQLGHHFRATKKAMGAVEKRKDVTTLETRKDGLKFTTKPLMLINQSWKQLSAEYEERQSTLMTQFKETIASYLEPLDEVCALICELDIFVAFATAATDVKTTSSQFVRPKVMPMPSAANGLKRVFKLTAGRHPLVEAQLMKTGGKAFVSNSLDLGEEGTLLALITGPNMGGKSTFIRTAGVCALLAQIGMFVPCEAMEMTLIDAMLARLGAADYMSRGVSTFMAEMLETNTILANATSNSFVIIDELGRGTSTHDGYGLAYGIAEHLVSKTRCCTLFATHFHELTSMSEELKHVTNLHVKADTSGDELRMLYEVHPGACSKSYGINVAKITRFPAPVVAAAKRKTELLESMSSGNKRRRVQTDEDCDKFLIGWLEKFKAIPLEAASLPNLEQLEAEFTQHAGTFPQLAQLMDAEAPQDGEADMVLG
eukprot:TRINITY_DN32146_c0_g1_i1.p1 TRINITY_DN32146_c0_g1~~TRINITY_DN32146_c0_g1_i1.p1  ORF type:complete len:931 (+),score=388.33 TRINITY_DN32146_c0_g1_i1:49-2841(+)